MPALPACVSNFVQKAQASSHVGELTVWALERNSLPLEQRKADDFTVVPEYDTLYTLCDLKLCFWLSKFVHEIKKKDGSEYPLNTLDQICAGLQRASRENGLPELKMFRNPRYKLFQDSIDSRMKALTRTGLGVNVKQAKPISGDEEEILWSKGLLGEDDPRTLVTTLVYLFGKYFSLRSGEEHRELRLFSIGSYWRGHRKELCWRITASQSQGKSCRASWEHCESREMRSSFIQELCK